MRCFSGLMATGEDVGIFKGHVWEAAFDYPARPCVGAAEVSARSLVPLHMYAGEEESQGKRSTGERNRPERREARDGSSEKPGMGGLWWIVKNP